MIDTLIQQLLRQSPLEWIAVVTALGYLILAIKQSIWCWPCAFVSTSIYVYLFGSVALFMESALNVFYLAMAVYGFVYWLKGKPDGAENVPVTQLALRWHILAIATIALAVGVAGSQLVKTSQQLPYLDAATTFSAVWATWLTARKVIENWWYWLVIDVVSIGIYTDRGLWLTAALFVVYVLLIPVGYLAWRRAMQAERHSV
ncbi:MAG: nicotinamide riboside transporter PnuC [Pseudomonadota bacterium]